VIACFGFLTGCRPRAVFSYLLFAINIGADLGAMADAMKLLIGGPVTAYVLVFGLICVIAQILCSMPAMCGC
jgi:hypothetical protein